ncbi:hypothetical protein [Mesorhizobium sp. B2-3-4]|uniref:hypothetical protein n=1 Tax=Mesorhizobium sp. B2-3-4 TaxID=2589959 RepID=UPI00112B501D|nr:hypothetical protein [Mesorhizobium sp. B2-3-4]TPM25925.1 hypothetical protein FJ967_31990 [Mesorhizobium sp. B2-3-4]
MFDVTATDLHSYFNFDAEREADLRKFGGLIRKAAPSLACHFHQGTPAGSAGMRMRMIGYGMFRYSTKSGKSTEWPVIGMALQKSYISVYLSVTTDGKPILDRYRGKLGEMRSGRNNFSFVRFEQLRTEMVAKLIAETAEVFNTDPENPVRYREGS